ncbi:MAG: Fpg/Nei family DNA glycosylase [Beutenbergiaceae bacterium]
MPEMPQVQGLVDFLNQQLAGAAVQTIRLVSFTALKSVAVPPESLVGATVTQVTRHGKWIDLSISTSEGQRHLIFHLARAGWLRWYPQLPTKPARGSPTSPVALQAGFDRGGFALTEAGTRRKLAIYLVSDPDQVPMIASLGPDPLAPTFTPDALREVLQHRNQQLKGLLRDQSSLAGIGNAYSDEILHAARLSPFAHTRAVAQDADALERLYQAIGSTLRAAIDAASGQPATALKDAKRAGLAVHGRAGEPCPRCGDQIRQVSFADSSLQYCPRCQTGGTVLADRRMSKLLK